MAIQPDPNELNLTNCPSASSNPSCPLARGALAIRPGNQFGELWTVFVDGSNPPVNKGVWFSQGSGFWANNVSSDGITNCGDASGCGTQKALYDLALSVLPNNNGFYVGLVNLFRNGPANNVGLATTINL